MPESITPPSTSTTNPNFEPLVRFLVQPFLETPDALRLDCEFSPNRPKVWVRLAFEGADKGRVFGRGGRNIQAIRTILEAIAKLSGYSLHLDVYGGPPSNHSGDGGDEGERSAPRRPPTKRNLPRPTR